MLRGVFDPTPATIRLIERRMKLMGQGRAWTTTASMPASLCVDLCGGERSAWENRETKETLILTVVSIQRGIVCSSCRKITTFKTLFPSVSRFRRRVCLRTGNKRQRNVLQMSRTMARETSVCECLCSVGRDGKGV
jgi:hypothetical protein